MLNAKRFLWNNGSVMNGSAEASLGLLTFLSFGISIIAAVLAIDMYKLLRTGEFGRPWRLLIIASVMLVLLQVLKMAEVLNWQGFEEAHLAEIVELCFVMILAYAFYRQRKIFTSEYKAHSAAKTDDDLDDDLMEDEIVEPEEWQAEVEGEFSDVSNLTETPAKPLAR
jgi:hypothetical protein